MKFKFTPEEEEFREEVRRFFKSEARLAEKARREQESGIGWGPATWEFVRKVGAKGYLTPHWPEEYGGLNRSYMERYIVMEEMAYWSGGAGFGVGSGLVGPVLLHFGSDEQKQTFLPKISRGEIEFALGYTEPQAGSDLAALEIKAVRDGDYFVMNGQKLFNSACHYAQYHWLAARTDTSVPKHRGISMFMVDLDSPGISIKPLICLGGGRTNEVFYDDVRVPADRLVGMENHGWYHLMTALSYERNWIVGGDIYYFEQFLNYLKKTRQGNKTLINDPIVKKVVGQLAVNLEVIRLFGLRIACMVSKGDVPDSETAMAKVLGSETRFNTFNEWMKLLSLYGQLDTFSEHAVPGDVRHKYFSGVVGLLTRGTNDIMKNIIALRGLGLPRS